MTFLKELHKPDILDCIAHLSSDEVFTPPKLVNEMLNLLPPELFTSPNTKFLDPGCKSGVFLREIAKRLIKGLKEQIPDLQQRIEHIFTKQLYGIAITELTGLLARRSVYCSKSANGEYSICKFTTLDGNIGYSRTKHIWKNGKCILCGASQSQYDRGDILETHAYSFIHCNEEENTAQWKRLKDMKFDVIIGNPPYQLSDGGNGASARPIYQLFVEQAKRLNPRYITMITPSRWFAGGKGLDQFRESCLADEHLRVIVDFVNAKDCFPEISLSGGVNYFLWDRDHSGECLFINHHDKKTSSLTRKLNEFPIFIRFNEAIQIIRKTQQFKEPVLTNIVSSRNPFGIPSYERGDFTAFHHALKLFSSKGTGYISSNAITGKNVELSTYKLMLSKVTSEHAGEPDKEGKFKIISTIQILKPNEICTDSYLTIGNFKILEEAQNALKYLKTKFARFLLLQGVSSINLSKEKFLFVPIQNFTQEWTDEKLYKKYGLTKEEIEFIESMIKPME